jgi:poly(3-hydroxybutyrate) depolymerase
MNRRNNIVFLIIGTLVVFLMTMGIYQWAKSEPNTSNKVFLPTVSRQDELEPKKLVEKQIKQVSTQKEINVDGTKRTYIEQKAETSTGVSKLVVGLHGAKSSAELLQKTSRINTQLQDETMVVLYPNGLDGAWNDARTGKSEGDIAFIKILTDKYQKDFTITPEKTTIIGVSNGGFMAQTLFCNESSIKAENGIFVVAPLTVESAETCKTLPTNTTFILGTNDVTVPYLGGEIQSETGGEVLSVEKTFDRASKIMGCGEKADEKELKDSLEKTIVDCKNKGKLTIISRIGEGHISTVLKTNFDELLK